MNTKLKILIIFIGLVPYFSKSQSVEYSVKVLYMEKFARFTEWKGGLNGNFFIIAVLGKSSFQGELEKMAAKTKIKDKPVKIMYINNINAAVDCQLLYICSSEESNLPEIIKFIESHNILAISDTPGFCKKGIHFNFYIDDSETIKYEINPTALKKSNLTIEMQLLTFGKIIN